MAVHDDLAKISCAVEKLAPDPHEIVVALPIERNARAHAGVTEEIRPNCKRCAQ
jgi:hypothetical protein